jgi:hypothetical protein
VRDDLAVDPSNDYWAAMAQVLPVVALGIVLEVRTIVTNWTAQIPRWFRALQSVSWAAILLILALGENTALRALRGGAVAEGWPALCEWGVAAGLSILVISPALEVLIRANPELAAGLFSLHPLLALKAWRLDRSAGNYMRIVFQSIEHMELRLYLQLSQVRDMERWLSQAEDEIRSQYASARAESQSQLDTLLREMPQKRSEVAAIRSDIEEQITDVRARRKAYESDRAGTLSRQAEFRQDRRKWKEKERELLTPLLRTFGPSGPTEKAVGDLESRE